MKTAHRSNSLKKILVMAMFICLSSVSKAIDPPPAIGGEEPPCGEPFGVVCPIDGGVGFLVAAAVIYGSRKIYGMKFN